MIRHIFYSLNDNDHQKLRFVSLHTHKHIIDLTIMMMYEKRKKENRMMKKMKINKNTQPKKKHRVSPHQSIDMNRMSTFNKHKTNNHRKSKSFFFGMFLNLYRLMICLPATKATTTTKIDDPMNNNDMGI